MKKYLLIFFFLLRYNANGIECVDLLGEIEKYKKTQPIEQFMMIKDNNAIEYLIFKYKKNREFNTKVNSYLYDLKSTGDEGDRRYISDCATLLKLSKDTNQTEAQKIKYNFKKDIVKKFNKAIKIFFKNYPKNEIEAKACIGYANHATKLIAKYYSSSDAKLQRRIQKAIKKFDDCKQGESGIKEKNTHNSALDMLKGDSSDDE